VHTLTANEASFLKRYFGDSLDTDAIDIGSSLGQRAWSPYGNRISLNENSFVGMCSDNEVDLSNPSAASVFAHEATHVWQRQNGGWVTSRGALLQAEYSLGLGNPYAYSSPSDFFGGNIEQQGQIVQDFVFADRTGGNTAPFSTVARWLRQQSF
jgi:hypothetical protein